MKKELARKITVEGQHWVGDGFLVRNMFSYRDDAALFSPFLLLDYAEPTQFPPNSHRRGVGPHPHRGFETVTIVYDGGVEHRDSSGAGGIIGKGDVQWMTAAAGIVHEEWHSSSYAEKGGPFEMVQLWVNLPKKDKSHPARYQSINANSIPEIALKDGAGTVRVIAGSFEQKKGPAQTFTSMQVWDLRLAGKKQQTFSFPKGHNLLLLVLSGKVKVDADNILQNSELAVFGREGEEVSLFASEDSKILVLSGASIEEPVVGYGPFVMNTEDEIKEAYADFRAGLMGQT